MNSKRKRQKEMKRCPAAAAESLGHPSPVHKVTSQPVAANLRCSSYPDAAEKWSSAAVKAFFFFLPPRQSKESKLMQLPTEGEQACVRECVTAAGVWPPPTNEWHGKTESCSFTRGVVHTRRQSTPPSPLQKQVSVSRCRK